LRASFGPRETSGFWPGVIAAGKAAHPSVTFGVLCRLEGDVKYLEQRDKIGGPGEILFALDVNSFPSRWAEKEGACRAMGPTGSVPRGDFPRTIRR